MSVKLISVTPDAEKTMAYVARVSNPANQENDNYAGLLRYCIKHQHWSVFEQAFMTLEIETNRGIAAQILRHRSFTYQEFSQRYADSSLIS
jgi:thymidylate synthase (FAD)